MRLIIEPLWIAILSFLVCISSIRKSAPLTRSLEDICKPMDDPAMLDGSDAPPMHTETPPSYTKFKQHLRNALLLLDAFDQPTLAVLKHDGEFRDSVQRLLEPLTATGPLSELVEQANNGSDGIPRVVQPTALGECRVDTAPKRPISMGEWMPRNALQRMIDQYQDGEVSVYWIHLVQGEWVKDPLEGLVGNLNAQLEIRRMGRSSGGSVTGIQYPKDGTIQRGPVIGAFMAKDRLAIALMCLSLPEDREMLSDLQKIIDESSGSLVWARKDCDLSSLLLTTEGGQASPLYGILAVVNSVDNGCIQEFTAIPEHLAGHLREKIFFGINERLVRKWGLGGKIQLGEPQFIDSWTRSGGKMRGLFSACKGLTSDSTLAMDEMVAKPSISLRMEDRRVIALRAGSVYAGRTPTQWDGFLVSVSGVCLTDKSDFL